MGIFSLILWFFVLINVYIIMRSWAFIRSVFPGTKRVIYFTLFICLSLTFIISEAFLRRSSALAAAILAHVGSVWLLVEMYAFIYLIAVDLVLLVMHLIKPARAFYTAKRRMISAYVLGVFVFAISFILIYGSWEAIVPQVTKYDIKIAKRAAPGNDNFKIVFVSDTHLGIMIGSSRVHAIVDKINSERPDLVIFGGDIIDGDIQPFIDQKMGDIFRNIKAKYGVYGILGNHEYFGSNLNKAVNTFENSGIHMLIDENALINKSFYIVGRNDKTYERTPGKKRKSLNELLSALDVSKPVILLDHQPVNFSDTAKNGIDLELSGHTHHGQVWPASLLTQRLFELDWGYERKNNTQFIVSCGAGTWGPMVRIGSYSEIVEINLRLNK